MVALLLNSSGVLGVDYGFDTNRLVALWPFDCDGHQHKKIHPHILCETNLQETCQILEKIVPYKKITLIMYDLS